MVCCHDRLYFHIDVRTTDSREWRIEDEIVAGEVEQNLDLAPNYNTHYLHYIKVAQVVVEVEQLTAPLSSSPTRVPSPSIYTPCPDLVLAALRALL